MNDLVHIQNTDISVKEYRGQRVVTLKDVDMVHERPEGTARRNFNSNRNRFIDGEDYFVVSADEIRTSRMFPISDNDFTNKILLTEQGYLMLVKSFINRKIKRVQFSSKIDFQTLNTQLYSELEQRAGCDLGTRLRNMKQRMGNSGATKTAINSIRKIDVIEGDKKLREIFSKIVSEYEIKYCA